MRSSKRFYCVLIGLAVGVVCSAAAGGQNLRELAHIQAARNPGVPIQVPAAPLEFGPKPVEQLAKEADAVVLARLSRVRSYLGRSEDRVLTDYLVTEPTVIAGRLPVSTEQMPGAGKPLVLAVFGGEITIEGVPVRSLNVNFAAIKDGARYLIFLRQSQEPGPGRFEIYDGGIFEILQDSVTPLLSQNASIMFKGSIDGRPSGLVARIQKAVRER